MLKMTGFCKKLPFYFFNLLFFSQLVNVASVNASMIASYPMNEASWAGAPPQVLDATGNGHNGTAVGGAETVPDATLDV